MFRGLDDSNFKLVSDRLKTLVEAKAYQKSRESLSSQLWRSLLNVRYDVEYPDPISKR